MATSTRHYQGCTIVFHLLYNRIKACGALTQLVGHQEEHPVCKNGVMRCYCGYLSAVRRRLFAHGPAAVTASRNPIISCLI